VFWFAGGARVVDNDPRRFGSMTLVAAGALDAHPLFRDLGVEPLGDAFDGPPAFVRSLRSQGRGGPSSPLRRDDRAGRSERRSTFWCAGCQR